MVRASCKVVLLVAVVLGAACSRTMEVFVELDEPAGLRSGAPVYLDEQQVGKVSALQQQAGGYLISLALDPARVAVLRRGSAARVAERDGAAVLILHNSLRGTAPLADGERLQGLASPLDYSAWQAAEALGYASGSLSQVMASVNEYLESERWQRQQQEMREHLERMDQATRDAVSGMQADIEALVRELGESAGAANDQLTQRYRELSRQLEQQMAELAERGEQEVMEPLREFLQALEPLVEPEEQQQR